MSRRPYRYLADPTCVAGIALYWAHRTWIKPTAWGGHGLLHDYLNDFLLIPVFLPPALMLQRWVGIRRHDRPPSAAEVATHVGLWSVLFVVVFPHFAWLYRNSTADPYNAVAFAVGGVAGWSVWKVGSNRDMDWGQRVESAS